MKHASRQNGSYARFGHEQPGALLCASIAPRRPLLAYNNNHSQPIIADTEEPHSVLHTYYSRVDLQPNLHAHKPPPAAAAWIYPHSPLPTSPTHHRRQIVVISHQSLLPAMPCTAPLHSAAKPFAVMSSHAMPESSGCSFASAAITLIVRTAVRVLYST